MGLLRTRTAKTIAIWLAVALFVSVQSMVMDLSHGAPIDWQWDVVHELVYWLTWAAFTPPVLRVAERWSPDSGAVGRIALPHFATALVIAPLEITTVYLLHAGLLVATGHLALAAMPGWLIRQKPGFVWGAFAGVIYYWMIVLTWWSVMFLRMYRTQQATAAKLETSLAAARLDALRAQLQPHFLFNTLNAISVLADEDPSKAKRMLLRLADLLRLTLAEGGKQEVRLSEELELLEHYLDIQRARFEDRLALRFDVAPAARDAFVPVLLLQPLVENAIRHGVDPSVAGGTIAVIARRTGDALRLEVRDNGRGLSPSEGTRKDGVGLANTRARLATLYGERQRLELVTPPEGGAAVVISLPFRTLV